MPTCNKCNWVYFTVTREFAENEVKAFNEYFDTLSKDKQDNYYGGKKSLIENYEFCHCGNGYKNFRESLPTDCPDGCTMNPIINGNE